MSTYIQSLRTTDGFLKNARVEFSPGLTCIIGARGTCKSTLVETIRFAFDCNPERVACLVRTGPPTQGNDSHPTQGLISETLRDGRVCCEIEERGASGTNRITVEREMGLGPQIYREGVRELADTSVLQRLEIYSQGDLELIAQVDQLRLDLIDRPHKISIDALKAERERNAANLRAIGPKIRTKRIEIESKRVEVRGLEGLRAQLSELQSNRPSFSEELDRERADYQARGSFLESLESVLEQRRESLNTLLMDLQPLGGLPGLAEGVEQVDVPESRELLELLERHQQFVQTARATAQDEADIETDGLLAAVRSRLEGLNARYYELRREQQAINDSLKREDALKDQIAHLERQQSSLEQMIADVAELARQRQSARDAIRRIGDEICNLRIREVEAINARHSDVIILALEPGVRSPGYTEKLGNLLKGSNLRHQADVVRDLAEKIRPSDLVDIVEKSDASRLATALNRDIGQMTRLIGHLSDSAGLYELDGIIFEDRLEITMYDEGVLKPVGQLSQGQMATALLPLILRSADYPLIFDQPEDDLDNRFIYKTLVEIVRSLKQERQLIFVTHNANIPVLGEADSVIVMQMETPLAAAAPICGGVDEVKEHILNILEGGKEAFRQRQEKYQALLGQ
ncbi:AAA family ATPase [Tautonia sp. JC769]|uniref:ATP-binding protein n=1 Tax=Tautonia sp. JC769 TaxID=3232135 RepID=UPI00345932F5